MLAGEKQGASQTRRINTILPDHIAFIKEQIKVGKFLKARGREVLIAIAGSNLNNIVTIPSKDEGGYIRAWINVYNLSLDYLEGMLNYACAQNTIIKKINNIWTINEHPFSWPAFDSKTASYARGLVSILNEYYRLNTLNAQKPEDEAGLQIKKSSVMLTPADKVNYSMPKIEEPKPTFKIVENMIANKEVSIAPVKKEKVKSDHLLIQKLSDGASIDKRDIEQLKDTDIVVLTCQDVNNPKEEDLYLNNMTVCGNANFNTGAFIYGKATDEHMGTIEVKRILDMVSKDNNFSGLLIYSINDDYVVKNKNSEIKLLDYINVYNAVAGTLRKSGYEVLLSMDLDSAEVIDDLNDRYNMQNEFEVLYEAIVRDADRLHENSSSIIVDPGNDYDIVTINNREIENHLSKNNNKTGLAKVA